jgi:putative ABC transport system permease protein
LAAMGIPIIAGRDFAWTDDAGSPPVALVDARFARVVWPDEPVVGRIVTVDKSRLLVVGVVTQARQYHLESDDRPQVYRPYAQDTTLGLTLAIRATTDASALVPPLRRIVGTLDPTLPIAGVANMDTVVDDARLDRRLQMQLLTGSAVLAVLLTGLGIYGLLSAVVADRAREIGIRMALGATVPAVSQLVLSQTMWLVIGGLLAGLGVALGGSTLFAHFLFALSPHDAASFVATTALVLVVALLASVLPLRRATAIDPARALRKE